MAYIRLSDISPNLPMSTYEYARMKAFESAGLDHEAAKTKIYAERGSSGQPKLALGPGDQPAPQPAAAVAPSVASAAQVSATTPWSLLLHLQRAGGDTGRIGPGWDWDASA